jgi:hypothetical protein
LGTSSSIPPRDEPPMTPISPMRQVRPVTDDGGDLDDKKE